MARTVAHVLTRVREVLQDDDGTRYPQDQLIGYINDAVLEARSIRPDLFVGAFAVALTEVSAPADPLPLPDQFFPALWSYVAGRAELRDDEFALDGRAMTLASTFSKKLLSGA